MNWKRFLILLFIIIAAVVFGALIAMLAAGNAYLGWLAFSTSGFGVPSTTIDLNILKIDFGLMININVAQVILLIVGLVIFSRLKIRR